MDPVPRIASAAGIDAATAERALGIILNFLVREGPQEPVQRLLAAIPGSAERAAAGAAEGGGFFAMGGLMGAGQRLMGLGLGMGQVSTVTREVIAYARETAGEDVVGEIVGGIPGLSQFA